MKDKKIIKAYYLFKKTSNYEDLQEIAKKRDRIINERVVSAQDIASKLLAALCDEDFKNGFLELIAKNNQKLLKELRNL